MIDFVIDTSAIIELMTGYDPDAHLRRTALTGLGAAPELLDIEVAHVLHSLVRRERLTAVDGELALRRILDTPYTRVSHRPLVPRIWQLRDTITAYDAAYVALAEQLGVPLLTCDARLGRAHGHRAEIVAYPRS